MLASLEDINLHLPSDKIAMDDGFVTAFSIDTENIIKAYLSGVFTPITLASWDEPDHTPGIIRSVAGRLVAAMYYRERYAADSDVDPAYAQNKYNEAMSVLMQIQNGKIIIAEAASDSDDQFNSLDFYPNDTAPDPIFSIGMEFG